MSSQMVYRVLIKNEIMLDDKRDKWENMFQIEISREALASMFKQYNVVSKDAKLLSLG